MNALQLNLLALYNNAFVFDLSRCRAQRHTAWSSGLVKNKT